MPDFVPGLELAGTYWAEVVRDLVDADLPASRRAIARIGDGSDVLGFDTGQSTDHGWGPRLEVFVDEGMDRARRRALEDRIDDGLPESFHGYPTRFSATDGEAPRHQVRVTTLAEFFIAYLGFDPTGPIGVGDWLGTPSQCLRAVTGGAVFEDGPGHLTEVRGRLAWYPEDVWLYLLGCQWRRLGQEEPFFGRCRQVGDDLGAMVVGGRLARDLIKLGFLIDRQYAPYGKWLGTAFSRLPCGSTLAPLLTGALRSGDGLLAVFEAMATRFNDLGLVAAQATTARRFYQRPFLVLGCGRFAEACFAATPLGGLPPIGSVDQVVDSTDLLAYPDRYGKLAAALYGPAR
jgi:hypothetical protein